ncbi:hypothetical protein NLX83_27870 [Allokutzneria sp. A3M-2-11 16]|uniref:hypothetical protein n=1 Tax=Allokutzneria sp. A3M-2-11 16 TaxID=2962043 RepID=UPI0020B71F7E|nr:hypothetical protein [Allokutzneria sp. A3M-2-11 16]MCP3803100.1 hypothetical protein [Allokutzneria sp. A3M-2-11 16]
MSNFGRFFVTAHMSGGEGAPSGDARLPREFVAVLRAAGELDEDDDDELGKAYWDDRYFEYM